MGKPTGFLEHARHLPLFREREERLHDYREVSHNLDEEGARTEASRCMDCGVPFCSWGCPLGNVAPDFNDLVYRGRWREALDRLHKTNNFPELTGLVCPAPCEAACVLGVSDQPVSIRQIEWEIVRRGFESGWITPRPAPRRSGRRVAIVGSGPAGLAAAQELARAGHDVTVFEKSDRIGGLLRYGIPDFKLEKWILDRRLAQLEAEGVVFAMGVQIGRDVPAADLVRGFDAVLLAMGCGVPRNLDVPGRELEGVHFALDFLVQQNRRCAGDDEPERGVVVAQGKRVVVLGGGDTGSDCVGTALRQGALSVTSLELQDRPPDARDPSTPWPRWPLVFRTSSSHDEGGDRAFGVLTKSLSGEGGQVQRLHAVHVAWDRDDAGRRALREVPGSEHTIECDLVLLALGFAHPVRDGLLADLGVALDGRGNVAAPKAFATSVPGVFAAGDVRRGQSLVVWALSEGRDAAAAIDAYLADGVENARRAAPATLGSLRRA